MATVKINVMSIVAIVVTATAIIAFSLAESPYHVNKGERTYRVLSNHYVNTYEAFLIISIIIAIVVLIITCLNIERFTGKTFLMYALASILLLIGIIVFIVNIESLDDQESLLTDPINNNKGWTDAQKKDMLKPIQDKYAEIYNYHVASCVFGVVALIAALAGTIAPFVCGKK